jgi:hypothetical protein
MLEGVAQRGIEHFVSSRDLLARQLEFLRREPPLLEALGQLDHRRIAVTPDLLDDRSRYAVSLAVEPERTLAQPPPASTRVAVVVTQVEDGQPREVRRHGAATLADLARDGWL